MKKSLIMTVLFMTAFTMPAFAWRVPGNPDQFPSIGFNVSELNVDGRRIEADHPLGPVDRVFVGTDKRSTSKYGADLRLPIHPRITLSLFYDSITIEEDFVREGNVHNESSHLEGQEFGFSVRCYLSR